eukprot:3561684-Amphidinium_carterae.1
MSTHHAGWEKRKIARSSKALDIAAPYECCLLLHTYGFRSSENSTNTLKDMMSYFIPKELQYNNV